MDIICIIWTQFSLSGVLSVFFLTLDYTCWLHLFIVGEHFYAIYLFFNIL